jgi:adenylate kinase
MRSCKHSVKIPSVFGSSKQLSELLSLRSDMSAKKPTIIGLYGISGSGKPYLLNQLKSDADLKNQKFRFYDGSELLYAVTPGGLLGFHQLSPTAKVKARKDALAKVFRESQDRGETAVITGHYLFWGSAKNTRSVIAGIDKDWETDSHIIYLNTDPDLVARQIGTDTKRDRSVTAVEELRQWQDEERNALRKICHSHGILFTTLASNASSANSVTTLKLKTLLKDFTQHTENLNLLAIDDALNHALGAQNTLEKVLVLDADKTLAPHDTGAMFRTQLASHADYATDPLTAMFKLCGYSYASFRQATLLYEETSAEFDTVCNEVADKVELYPGMEALLARVAKEEHVGAVIVTCGLRAI